MAKGHFELLRALFKPVLVKIGAAVGTGLAIYDSASNQFNLPKLGKLLGMSGSLLPWWGWLLVLQAVFVYALFEYVRRMAPSVPSGSSPDLDFTEIDKLRSQIEARVAPIEQMNRSIVDDYQRMLALKGEFEESSADIYKQLDALAAHQSLNADAVAARFNQVYGSLAAIWHRERLHHLAQALETAAAELSVPTTHEAHLDEDQWEAWEQKEQEWRAVLSQWCELAAPYVPPIREQVLTVPEEHYKQSGVATIKQFPTPEALFTYKAFCAVLRNWREDRQEVYGVVHAVAFEARAPQNGALLPSFRSGK